MCAEVVCIRDFIEREQKNNEVSWIEFDLIRVRGLCCME